MGEYKQKFITARVFQNHASECACIVDHCLYIFVFYILLAVIYYLHRVQCKN